MPLNTQAVATWGFQTGDTVIHNEAVAKWGWVDNSPAPPEPSFLSAESTVHPGEFNPGDIRRAFSKLNDIFARRFSVNSAIMPSGLQVQGEMQIRYGVSVISSVNAANDSITLPEAKANGFCKVVNATALDLQVFPDTDDKIDGGATDASMTVSAGKIAVFEAVDATDWYSFQQ